MYMDPAAISAIAASTVTILSPYLAKAAETIIPKAAEDIYAALRGRLSRKPAAAEALKDLEKAPTDEDTQAALRAQLKKVLAEDEEFAMQLRKLVEEAEGTGARSTVAAANRGVAAGRDISGPTFTGDVQGDIDIGASRDPRTPDE
jgi:hypothetical protein